MIVFQKAKFAFQEIKFANMRGECFAFAISSFHVRRDEGFASKKRSGQKF